MESASEHALGNSDTPPILLSKKETQDDSDTQAQALPSCAANNNAYLWQQMKKPLDLGTIVPVMQNVSGGTIVGFNWQNTAFKFDVGFGFCVDHASIDAAVTNILNRFFDVKSKKAVEIFENEYFYKVKEDNLSAKITVYYYLPNGKRQQVSDTISFKQTHAVGHEKKRSKKISDKVTELLNTCVNQNFTRCLQNFHDAFHDALNTDSDRARQLITEFCNKKYAHLSGILNLKQDCEFQIDFNDFNIKLQQACTERNWAEAEKLIHSFSTQYHNKPEVTEYAQETLRNIADVQFADETRHFIEEMQKVWMDSQWDMAEALTQDFLDRYQKRPGVVEWVQNIQNQISDAKRDGDLIENATKNTTDCAQIQEKKEFALSAINPTGMIQATQIQRYQSALFGLGCLTYGLKVFQNKIHPTFYRLAHLLVSSMHLLMSYQLRAITRNHLSSSDKIRISAAFMLQSVLPLFDKYLPAVTRDIVTTGTPICFAAHKLIENMYAGQHMDAGIQSGLELLLPLASQYYYQRRYANGRAPESLAGVALQKITSLPSDIHVNFFWQHHGSIAGFIAPCVAVDPTLISAAIIVGFLIWESHCVIKQQHHNKQHNTQFAFLNILRLYEMRNAGIIRQYEIPTIESMVHNGVVAPLQKKTKKSALEDIICDRIFDACWKNTTASCFAAVDSLASLQKIKFMLRVATLSDLHDMRDYLHGIKSEQHDFSAISERLESELSSLNTQIDEHAKKVDDARSKKTESQYTPEQIDALEENEKTTYAARDKISACKNKFDRLKKQGMSSETLDPDLLIAQVEQRMIEFTWRGQAAIAVAAIRSVPGGFWHALQHPLHPRMRQSNSRSMTH